MKKTFAFLIALTAVGGLLTGCATADTPAETAPAPDTTAAPTTAEETDAQTEAEPADDGLNKATTLNIAYQPVVGYAPLFILRDNTAVQDALAAAGYDVEVTFTSFESGPPENEAFASGLQDIGVAGNVPTVSGIAAGQERSIIGIAYNGEKTEAILVGTDSGISSVEDLSGKKLGLVVGSIANNLVYNLQIPDDVEVINLSTGEQEAALSTGQVDAVATWEPTLTKIQTDGVGKVLADGTGVFLAENPIFGRTEYIEQNPEIVQIFLNVYKETADALKADPEQYAAVYAEELGLEEATFLTALEHSDLPVAIKEADAADLQGTVDFLYNSEIITTSFNVADHIIYTFSDALN